MSTSKLDRSGVFSPVKIGTQETQLSLTADAIRFRANGIEFRAGNPIAQWTEMTVEVQSLAHANRSRFHGVVVACRGNRHAGYVVSMVFMNLSKQSKAKLEHLAFAHF